MTELECTVLDWTRLECTVLDWTGMYSTRLDLTDCTVLACTLWCTVLFCLVLSTIVFYCSVVMIWIVLHLIVHTYRTGIYCTVFVIIDPVLCCFALYRTEQHCQALYGTVLYSTEINWTGLYCAVLYFNVLFCFVLHCAVLYCTLPVFQRHLPAESWLSSPAPSSASPELFLALKLTTRFQKLKYSID